MKRKAADYESYLSILKKNYSKYDFSSLSYILNNSIYETANDLDGKSYEEYPIKLQIAFSFILMINQMNTNDDNDGLDIHSKYSINSKINKFKKYIFNFNKILLKKTNFLNYSESDIKYATVYNLQYFEFQLISIGEFIEFFHQTSIYSKSCYGFEIDNNVLIFILHLLGCIKLKGQNDNIKSVYPKLDEKNYKFLETSETINDISKLYNINPQLKENIKNTLFIDINNPLVKKINNEITYPDKVYENLNGFIGIKDDDKYFIPKNFFMLRQLMDKIINHKSKKYGHVFEKIVFDKFGEYLNSSAKRYDVNMFKSYELLDGDRKEQDILIKLGNKIIIIECKSNNFKSVNYKNYVSKNRNIIGKGIDQANRVEKHIVEGNGEFINSDGNKFYIKHNEKFKFYKIVVTFNNFNLMSMRPEKFFKDKIDPKYTENIWVIDYFKLNEILWKCKDDNINILLSYIEKRNDLVSFASASDELEYFINYYEHGDFSNISGFSGMFLHDTADTLYDEYGKYKTDNEFEELYKRCNLNPNNRY